MTGVEEGAALGEGAAAAGGAGVAAGGLTAAQYAALAASIGGTAASMVGQQQAAQQRRDILNKQATATDAANDKAEQLVTKEGTNYQADARDAALTAQKVATAAQSNTDLGTAPTAINGAGDAGAVSNDYLAAKGAREGTEATRLGQVVQQMAAVRAPGQLQQTEAMRRADLAGTLQDMWSAQKNATVAAQNDANGVEQPWWGQAGQLAGAVGNGYLAGGGLNSVATPSAAPSGITPALVDSAASTDGYGPSSFAQSALGTAGYGSGGVPVVQAPTVAPSLWDPRLRGGIRFGGR